MYKRLTILSVIIVAAVCGLTWLGYHAVQKWAQGLEGTRLGEFAAAAEQIRQDVKRKLDRFMQTEQNRPYTDYQYYYVPQNIVSSQAPMPLMRSPLAGQMAAGFAYGSFQLEPNGRITTVNDNIIEMEGATEQNTAVYAKTITNRRNIEKYLLPALDAASPGSFKIRISRTPTIRSHTRLREFEKDTQNEAKSPKQQIVKGAKTRARRTQNYPIESLQSRGQKTQVISRQRASYQYDTIANTPVEQQQRAESSRRQQLQTQPGLKQSISSAEQPPPTAKEEPPGDIQLPLTARANAEQPGQVQTAETSDRSDLGSLDMRPPPQEDQAEMVQIRIEPFVPVIVDSTDAEKSIFGGQVFFLRHVQIEDRHLLQGFQLNEEQLTEEVGKSAARFMQPGMGFELAREENGDSAYTAVLDFGFGNLVLNLKEVDPAWIARQITQFRSWYAAVTAIVFLAIILGLTSLWHNMRTQLKLAQKKDDFISAVSHELRTPLTSIRMYAEMLEKNWVKSEEKLAEYYKNMRQESERLSRLIENVLDFSRIQRGRKKYSFILGDINRSIRDVVEMMTPYAEQNGFSIKTDLEPIAQATFDHDAVTQIVVNLLDNAVKYARDAADKTITVRTRSRTRFILIEVEDHGPGVPHRQRKRVFEQFYRTGSEATRETNGTGLGLALVKKFTEAHNGFVEILTAKPTGAIFRVALASKSQ